eukprot:Platyproteum_vivax@DN6094_c0_g1_i1.p1
MPERYIHSTQYETTVSKEQVILPPIVTTRSMEGGLDRRTASTLLHADAPTPRMGGHTITVGGQANAHMMGAKTGSQTFAGMAMGSPQSIFDTTPRIVSPSGAVMYENKLPAYPGFPVITQNVPAAMPAAMSGFPQMSPGRAPSLGSFASPPVRAQRVAAIPQGYDGMARSGSRQSIHQEMWNAHQMNAHGMTPRGQIVGQQWSYQPTGPFGMMQNSPASVVLDSKVKMPFPSGLVQPHVMKSDVHRMPGPALAIY